MGFMHIKNLYACTDVLLFKRCYALEKIDGTSAHIGWTRGQMSFSSGGAPAPAFRALFHEDELRQDFLTMGHDEVVVYGEAYGGKIQKKSLVYGAPLRFVVFEAKVGDSWLSVPSAASLAAVLGLEFVPYAEVDATVEALNAERDRPSVQAERNGMGVQKREGVVVRPLIELTKNNGERIVAKHKAADERETATEREVDPEKRIVFETAEAAATEWVTDKRLEHVLCHLFASRAGAGDPFEAAFGQRDIRVVIDAVVEDVTREGAEEIPDTRETRRAIAGRASKLFRNWLAKKNLPESSASATVS